MEQCSILSNIVNNIQYERHPKNFHNLNISTLNKEKYKRNSNIEEEERHLLELSKPRQKNHFQYQNKGIQWENYYMEQNVKYY